MLTAEVAELWRAAEEGDGVALAALADWEEEVGGSPDVIAGIRYGIANGRFPARNNTGWYWQSVPERRGERNYLEYGLYRQDTPLNYDEPYSFRNAWARLGRRVLLAAGEGAT